MKGSKIKRDIIKLETMGCSDSLSLRSKGRVENDQ
jgi:hypothetical protein